MDKSYTEQLQEMLTKTCTDTFNDIIPTVDVIVSEHRGIDGSPSTIVKFTPRTEDGMYKVLNLDIMVKSYGDSSVVIYNTTYTDNKTHNISLDGDLNEAIRGCIGIYVNRLIPVSKMVENPHIGTCVGYINGDMFRLYMGVMHPVQMQADLYYKLISCLSVNMANMLDVQVNGSVTNVRFQFSDYKLSRSDVVRLSRLTEVCLHTGAYVKDNWPYKDLYEDTGMSGDLLRLMKHMNEEVTKQL